MLCGKAATVDEVKEGFIQSFLFFSLKKKNNALFYAHTLIADNQ
jgi:hypothetical protein